MHKSAGGLDAQGGRGALASPQSEHKPTAGRPLTVYHLEKRDTFVFVAQLSPEFTAKVLDRWQELEQQRSLLEGVEICAELVVLAQPPLHPLDTLNAIPVKIRARQAIHCQAFDC